MALEAMGYTNKTVNDGYEILYNSQYVGKALTLDTTAFTDGVCKAGTPVSATGKKAVTDTSAKTSDALGILLHDVHQDRPQGTAVIGGYINTSKAQTHSGVTYDDATKATLKNVAFM